MTTTSRTNTPNSTQNNLDPTKNLWLTHVLVKGGCPFGNHLQDSNWTYSFHGTTATIEFTEYGFVGLEFNAQGHVLKEFVCHGDEANVFVLRTTNQYDVLGSLKYLYMCMQMTQVSDNLYYFYLLGDPNSDITPNARLFSNSDSNLLFDKNSLCSTLCSYSTTINANEIHILQKVGTNESLTGEEVLCGLCTTTPTCPISTYPSNTNDTSTTDDDISAGEYAAVSDLSAGEYAAIGCGIGGVCIFSAIAAKFGYRNCIAKKKIGSKPTEKNGKVGNIEETNSPQDNNSTKDTMRLSKGT